MRSESEKTEKLERTSASRLVGALITGMDECELAEGDKDAPEGALNRLSLALKCADGSEANLDFYNYRIEEKNFEYTPAARIIWMGCELFDYGRSRFFIEAELRADGNARRLALGFEEGLIS